MPKTAKPTAVGADVLKDKVIAFFADKDIDIKGECYTEDEWGARGERCCEKAGLVVIHDGGSHAPYFNHDYGAYGLMEELRLFVEPFGWYVEQGTSWYSGFYEI